MGYARPDTSDVEEEMVRIPAAEIATTGAPHRIEAFLIDVTEVTTAAYERCVADGACTEPEPARFPELTMSALSAMCNYGNRARANHPINCVRNEDARAYCGWANKRLLTSEEWVYAAQGPAGSRYPWGAEQPWPDYLCWTRSARDAGAGTCAVGSFETDTSVFGVKDVAGNVAEWTLDRDVVRGGSFLATEPAAVTTDAIRERPRRVRRDLWRWADMGFRCARDARE